MTCPACGQSQRFESVLTVTTAIAIEFDAQGEEVIPDDAEARELSAYRDGYVCGACDHRFGGI